MPDTTPPAPVIDLSTKFRGPDGKEVTIGDLFTLAAQVPSLQESQRNLQATIQKVQQRNSLLFNSGANQELRLQALRETLQESGRTKEEIDAYLANHQAGGGSETEDGDQDGGDEGDDEVSLMRAQLEEARREIQSIREAQGQDRTRGLGTLLANRLKLAMQKPEVVKMLAVVKEKDRPQVEQRLMKSLDAEVRLGLNERLARGEKIIDRAEQIFDEEIGKSLPVTLAPFQSVIAGFEGLGPTAETATGFEQLLKKAPPAPDYKDGMGTGQLKDAIEASFVHDLAQGAHELAMEEKQTPV